jgi:hypothetical protein
MVARGPAEVGAHAGQLGEHYGWAYRLSTRAPDAYALAHDNAYVPPSVVGRLTAAGTYACTQRPPLRRPFLFLPPGVRPLDAAAPIRRRRA